MTCEPLSASEKRQAEDILSFNNGIMFRSVRSKADGPESLLTTTPTTQDCDPVDGCNEDQTPYGYNSVTGQPMPHFKYYSYDLLQNPKSAVPTSRSSDRRYQGGGFAAFIIPFVSDAFIPYGKGPRDQFQTLSALKKMHTPGNSEVFHCVRTSTNGYDIEQVCDTNPNSGLVKKAAYDLVQGLKDLHWIDFQTRLVEVSFTVNGKAAKTKAVVTFTLELATCGSIKPSDTVRTMHRNDEQIAKAESYMYATLVMWAIFIVLEFVEIYLAVATPTEELEDEDVEPGPSGLFQYASDVW
jgi:hypothetical protein